MKKLIMLTFSLSLFSFNVQAQSHKVQAKIHPKLCVNMSESIRFIFGPKYAKLRCNQGVLTGTITKKVESVKDRNIPTFFNIPANQNCDKLKVYLKQIQKSSGNKVVFTQLWCETYQSMGREDYVEDEVLEGKYLVK